MIKNSQKPNRSALVASVIILIILVTGVLGFIFWQNFTNKSIDTSGDQSTNETANTDQYKDWNAYESVNSKYSIKYPKDWIALKETVQDGPYIRNFNPTPQPEGGYPNGYINIRILHEENDADFKAKTGYTTVEWYDALGKIRVQSGTAVHLPEDVKEMKISGLPAKSTKAVFTETNEVIYVLRGDNLYSINLYPYGISSDLTVKLILDSFTFTY